MIETIVSDRCNLYHGFNFLLDVAKRTCFAASLPVDALFDIAAATIVAASAVIVIAFAACASASTDCASEASFVFTGALSDSIAIDATAAGVIDCVPVAIDAATDIACVSTDNVSVATRAPATIDAVMKSDAVMDDPGSASKNMTADVRVDISYALANGEFTNEEYIVMPPHSDK